MLERNLTYLCDKINFILCYIYKIYLKFRLKYKIKCIKKQLKINLLIYFIKFKYI